MLNVEIYGRSNCPWCEKSKALFDNLNIKYNYFTLNSDYTKEELLEKIPGVSTVPQIFINGKHVGGFGEVALYLEEVISNYAHDMN